MLIEVLDQITRMATFLEGKMHLRQGKRETTILLLTALFLLSFLLAACNLPWASAPQLLPTLTAEPGWKIVLQTHGETTDQREEKVQTFSLGQFSAGAYLRLSIACAGQGSMSVQTKTPYIALSTLTCTDIPRTATVDSPVDTSQPQLTVHLTIHGLVQWGLLIREPI